MSQSFSQTEFDLLESYANAGNRVAYYSLLASKGYSYATLALGVVQNNTVSGVTARNYAEVVAAENNLTIDWELLSVDLMRADLLARSDIFLSGEANLTLGYDRIQSYHNSVFVNSGDRIPNSCLFLRGRQSRRGMA